MSQLNDYIQYLSKKPFWPWEKEDVEGKLIRLELIVEEGNRHIVNSLTPFLFHSDTRLRHKVANAVFQLVGPMDTVRRYSDMYLNVAANPAMLTYFQEKI
ncbi:MAG: hypothetical protein NVV59_17665 [Chitinophagaceae bacterium]|nr:hypothetical protein [Chitinophagaceae bacterium]